MTAKRKRRVSNLQPMPAQQKDTDPLPRHGSLLLPSVKVDCYSLELKDGEGFIGDRASKSAFAAILDKWRAPLRKLGDDPLGGTPSDDISKKKLDSLLSKGDTDEAGVVHSAVEEFAQQLASVIRRFLRTKGWRDTQYIAVGGGFRNSRLGELAIGRSAILLKSDELRVELGPIHHHPDEAGLIGALHLLPSWMIGAHDGIIAVDIGGTNIRAGVVQSNLKEAGNRAKAEVWKSERWRHAEDDPKRDEAVQRLTEMIKDLIESAAKAKIRIAPVIGIGCPGVIQEDGSIKAGAQNLPGNWESSRFNLAEAIRDAIPMIGDYETAVIIHNDAVVQGLSELPFINDFDRWGALTIGTGLGNARFTARSKELLKRGA
jgi:hypothetical protein